MGEGRHDASTLGGANAPTRRPPPALTTPTPLPRAHGLARGGRGNLWEATGVGAKASVGLRGESAAKGCVRKRKRSGSNRASPNTFSQRTIW